jgi:hypothetical protein
MVRVGVTLEVGVMSCDQDASLIPQRRRKTISFAKKQGWKIVWYPMAVPK